jgi:D-alanine transfer protein
LSFLKSHIWPALIAFLLISLLYTLEIFPEGNEKVNRTVCDFSRNSVAYANFDTVPEGVLPLVHGLQNPNCVVLLGSSELTSPSDYIPYNFFNSSREIQVRAFGHAYFQSFSMYCVLLSLREYLEGAKICIIVSPGWFETKGTNSQAFVEFVRPEMLANIAHDNGINHEYKNYISDYLVRIKSDLSGFTPAMEYFYSRTSSFLFQELRGNLLLRQIPSFYYCDDTITFRTRLASLDTFNWSSTNDKLVEKFNSGCSNDFQIEDSRFSAMTNGTKVLTPKPAKFIRNGVNQELHDFGILLKMLYEYGAKPTFVIQPMNPNVYSNLASFHSIMNQLLAECNQYNFQCLNLFESEKGKYTPGILNDGMHMGDVGWNRVNEFINLHFHQ